MVTDFSHVMIFIIKPVNYVHSARCKSVHLTGPLCHSDIKPQIMQLHCRLHSLLIASRLGEGVAPFFFFVVVVVISYLSRCLALVRNCAVAAVCLHCDPLKPCLTEPEHETTVENTNLRACSLLEVGGAQVGANMRIAPHSTFSRLF